MAQLLYTDPGDMDRLIDIWDQPTQPDADSKPQPPVPFRLNVNAKIEGLWATTEARKLAEQIVTEISHRITIKYIAGIRSRMFILYNDPDSTDDNGNVVPRRFDIDRSIDADEHKVELKILCIERNDGR